MVFSGPITYVIASIIKKFESYKFICSYVATSWQLAS